MYTILLGVARLMNGKSLPQIALEKWKEMISRKTS
jgi:hypothetical protein